MKCFAIIALCVLAFLLILVPLINTFAKALIVAVVIFVAYGFYKGQQEPTKK